jgi:LmbE family N-acetylglucosaminyl deacetylase
MKFHHATADFFVPDGASPEKALSRVTHMTIGAHQDDIELMSVHGVLACFDAAEPCFGGVTCTNGAGSARVGPYANVTNEKMCEFRREEQRVAASIGRYSFMAQLDYASSEVKAPGAPDLVNDLVALLQAAKPKVLYTHNPADKHDTHVGVVLAVIEACRRLPAKVRPEKLLGCEIWRDLDWMCDNEKVIMDISARQNLQAALYGVFDSQIAGGKRYDLAIMGRHRANATMLESHAADKTEMAAFAMDLTPLIKDDKMDVMEFVLDHIRRFEADVRKRMEVRLKK